MKSSRFFIHLTSSHLLKLLTKDTFSYTWKQLNEMSISMLVERGKFCIIYDLLPWFFFTVEKLLSLKNPGFFPRNVKSFPWFQLISQKWFHYSAAKNLDGRSAPSIIYMLQLQLQHEHCNSTIIQKAALKTSPLQPLDLNKMITSKQQKVLYKMYMSDWQCKHQVSIKSSSSNKNIKWTLKYLKVDCHSLCNENCMENRKCKLCKTF